MSRSRRIFRGVFECSLALTLFAGLAQAQPQLPPGELDRLVARIALYPDPLLAQILSAASYSDQIPEAAK